MTQGIEIASTVLEFDLADRMRKSLRHSDDSVQSIADYLDVSRGTVGNWINGRVEPSTQTLRLWALRTGAPYNWLRTGESPRQGNPNGGGESRMPESNRRPFHYKSDENVVRLPMVAAA